MRRVLTLVSALCAALALLSSCTWGGADGDGARPPGAPTGVTAAAGSATSVHVMWTAVSTEGGVRVYEVYRGPTKVKEVPGSAHMVDVTMLKPATTYAFTVRARDTGGRLGPPSKEVRATTPRAVAADRAAPTRPGRITGRAVGSRAVQLSWSTATDNRDVVSYDIHQGGTKIHSVGGNQTATVVTGLRPGTLSVSTFLGSAAGTSMGPGGGWEGACIGVIHA
ncbi:fibronectin type III domain-containing protein, partial [Streptomyces sp. NPDC002285]